MFFPFFNFSQISLYPYLSNFRLLLLPSPHSLSQKRQKSKDQRNKETKVRRMKGNRLRSALDVLNPALVAPATPPGTCVCSPPTQL